MKIYVLPVSGGGFAAQLGLLREIYKATLDINGVGITPDIVFASSGGNVAAYISLINNWSDVGIIKNSELLTSSIFIESWTPPFFPTWLAFPLTKSIYRNGDGVGNMFMSLYTPTSVKKTEIWTGTYNDTTQRAAMFCNKNINEAKIKDVGNELIIYDTEESVYLNGDLKKISQVCCASASIPYLTPGVLIGKNRYMDGGVSYASPLIPMSNHLSHTISKMPSSENIQITYFCSYDMSGKFSDSIYSRSIGLLIHSSLLQDRAFALSIIRQYGKIPTLPESHVNLTNSSFKTLMKKYKNRSYVMFLYPNGSPSVDMTTFKGSDVVKIINEVEKGYNAFIWAMTEKNE